jgi:hypothetical protein
MAIAPAINEVRMKLLLVALISLFGSSISFADQQPVPIVLPPMWECLDGTYALDINDCVDAYASLPPKIRDQKIAEIRRKGLVKASPGAVVRTKKLGR